MNHFGPDTDPFVSLGFSPEFSEAIVPMLKRGRNGEGYRVALNVEGRSIEVQPDQAETVSDIVDSRRPDAARLAAATIHNIIKQ